MLKSLDKLELKLQLATERNAYAIVARDLLPTFCVITSYLSTLNVTNVNNTILFCKHNIIFSEKKLSLRVTITQLLILQKHNRTTVQIIV